MKKHILMAVSLLLSTFGAQAQIITTIAGTGIPGYSGDGGAATNAELNCLSSLAVDGFGTLYFSDCTDHVIRKVSASGIITTVAGNGVSGTSGDGGPATTAELANPTDVTVDGSGNLYIADKEAFVSDDIRKVNTVGIISTVAGGGSYSYDIDGVPATTVGLDGPAGVAVDASGNLFIAENGNDAIRQVHTSGIINTFAGTDVGGYSGDGGQATAAKISLPTGIAFDSSGNLFFIDDGNNVIRKVNTSGIISTVAGNTTLGYSGDGGAATAAEIYPFGITLDGLGTLYIADGYNEVIRKVSTSGIITTIVGNGTIGYSGDGGPALAAELAAPSGVAVDGSGNLYIADAGNNVIRKVRAGSAGINQMATTHNTIAILPNPNNGEFTIKGSCNSTADETVSVEVLNMLGQVVYINTLTAQKGKINTDISLQDKWVSGIYLLQLRSETETEVLRIVVEK